MVPVITVNVTRPAPQPVTVQTTAPAPQTTTAQKVDGVAHILWGTTPLSGPQALPDGTLYATYEP